MAVINTYVTNYGRQPEDPSQGAAVTRFDFVFDNSERSAYDGQYGQGSALADTDFQSAFVDNSLNAFDVILANNLVGVEQRVPAYHQAYLPLFTLGNGALISMRTIGGPRTARVPVALISKPIGPSVWRAASAV